MGKMKLVKSVKLAAVMLTSDADTLQCLQLIRYQL